MLKKEKLPGWLVKVRGTKHGGVASHCGVEVEAWSCVDFLFCLKKFWPWKLFLVGNEMRAKQNWKVKKHK